MQLSELHPEGQNYGEKETYDDKKHNDVKHNTLVASLHTFVHKSHRGIPPKQSAIRIFMLKLYTVIKTPFKK